MTKFLAAALLALATSAIAKDKPEIRYAGQGRYTCSGDSYQCAQVNANNRALEQRERDRADARQERDYEQRQRDLERYGLKR